MILMMYYSQMEWHKPHISDTLLPWACVTAFPGVQYFMTTGLSLSWADTVQAKLQAGYIMLTSSACIITSVVYNFKQGREFNIMLDILHVSKVYQMIHKIILSLFCIY